MRYEMKNNYYKVFFFLNKVKITKLECSYLMI